MYKAAVLGSYDQIYAFAALGMDVIDASTPAEALAFIRKSAEAGYALIYVTEDNLSDPALAKVSMESDMPVIIPIPSVHGESGAGMNRIRKVIEQAVGSDIIFNE